MATTAQSIIKEVQRAFNDLAGDRAPASDLVPLLNRSQRDIQVARPDLTTTTITHELVAGYGQTIPASMASLIDIAANAWGERQRISKVDARLMNDMAPSWRSKTPSTVIKHFMHDERDPRRFDVYPPAEVGASVEMEGSLYPVDVPMPTGSGKAYSTVSGNISLPDEFSTALMCLTLHYAYLTDLEGAANQAIATGYLQRAEQILGVQLMARDAVAPKS
jgi:hypothetical protein